MNRSSRGSSNFKPGLPLGVWSGSSWESGEVVLQPGDALLSFSDGLSNCLLVGEKHVPEGKNGVGWWDCSLYNGDYHQCSTRTAGR